MFPHFLTRLLGLCLPNAVREGKYRQPQQLGRLCIKILFLFTSMLVKFSCLMTLQMSLTCVICAAVWLLLWQVF